MQNMLEKRRSYPYSLSTNILEACPAQYFVAASMKLWGSHFHKTSFKISVTGILVFDIAFEPALM